MRYVKSAIYTKKARRRKTKRGEIKLEKLKDERRVTQVASSNKECSEQTRRQNKTRAVKRSVLVKKGRSVEMEEIIFRH